MNQYTLIGIIIFAIIFAVVSFLLNKFFISKDNHIKSEDIGNELNKIFPNIIKELVFHSKEQLESQKKEIKTDLSNKKEIIEDLVKRVLNELDQSNKRLERAEKERVGSFQAIKVEMENQRKLTEQLNTTTEGLKKILSNNQLRGQFGEQVAEDLLRMTGFVKGMDYEYNKEQKGSATRPDFAVFLPDETRINIDVKFPYNNLQRYIESDDTTIKRNYLKSFQRDVQEKIKQVTTRDYINPEDKTVDFVILFIPNEMIFSFIYDKMNDVWKNGMEKKVILAGPFSFIAILRMVRQAYSNFKYQKNTQQIITLIKSFETEFEKYNNEFEKVGIRIESLQKQYLQVNTTRKNKLLRTITKIDEVDANTKDKNVKPVDTNHIIPIGE